MKKVSLLSFVLLIAACFSTSSAQVVEHDYLAIQHRAMHSTAALLEGGEAYCAGVSVNYAVLTAAHCVSRRVGETIHVKFYEDTAVRDYDIWMIDEDQDGAVLVPTGEPYSVYSLVAAQAPRLGAAVVHVGHPIGMEFSVNQGIVSSPRRTFDDDDPFMPGMVWMQHTAASGPGGSGGPVFNRRGRVVGLASFSARGLAHISGAVHHETIITLMRSVPLPVGGDHGLPD